MYFGFNYPHDFIEQCWKHDPNIVKHFRSKFSMLYQQHQGFTFFQWYMELSENYKVELNEWITHNYISFKHLKQD